MRGRPIASKCFLDEKRLSFFEKCIISQEKDIKNARPKIKKINVNTFLKLLEYLKFGQVYRTAFQPGQSPIPNQGTKLTEWVNREWG